MTLEGPFFIAPTTKTPLMLPCLIPKSMRPSQRVRTKPLLTDLPPQDHGECDNQPTAAEWTAGMEALMASKDKIGRSTKKAAAKNLKQKRLEKRAKRAGSGDKTSIG